ncbi:MAG: hypothetical protein PHH08_04785, partial [Candidatus ainarchaeum sp.]|nr:hypothetical protein [Candidatus ainarchaeum sp.]
MPETRAGLTLQSRATDRTFSSSSGTKKSTLTSLSLSAEENNSTETITKTFCLQFKNILFMK